MKTRGEQKLCFDVSDDRYYIPTGLHFFKCVKGTFSFKFAFLSIQFLTLCLYFIVEIFRQADDSSFPRSEEDWNIPYCQWDYLCLAPELFTVTEPITS